MSRDIFRAKGRRTKGAYISIPHRVLDSPAYVGLRPTYPGLSHSAVHLLVDLTRQFNGFNNGDLSAAWGLMRKRGWRSRSTLAGACNQLEERGLIRKTRQGGRNKCNLYAITWNAIDECRVKLDCSPTSIPPRDWEGWPQQQSDMTENQAMVTQKAA